MSHPEFELTFSDAVDAVLNIGVELTHTMPMNRGTVVFHLVVDSNLDHVTCRMVSRQS